MLQHQITNGRLKALKVLKKLGGKFRKSTALEKITEEGIQNPEVKFDFLLLNGNIEHIEGSDLYKVV